MTEHRRGCVCRTCQRLQARTIGTEAWRAQHLEHLRDPALGFTVEDFPHPSGTWFWLICVCGAKHLTMTRSVEP